ncbi:siroheme synthase CysG [secondary endosymbiont of Ctenarytaina eucalypti]|uniref:siroheme synthase CysG n=1 Tax=secondary endosymbiont of Ctenarytaina eucalypti TaxID=1199245 RepID=UPI0005C59011|nr:siroheme synthase CysG [secondary endosymbiont of Ctenarytaina eucalypti]
MDYLPLFADLKRRPVLVVGGGDVATRKIQLLMRAGAQIRVAARVLCPALTEIHHAGSLAWLGESFEPAMLDDVFLVIAATDDVILNAQVSRCAERRHLLANVVDDQTYCSFIFPSIVDRNPIIVAISSGGTAPVLSRMLREKLESILPSFLGPMAAIAGIWRGRVKERICSMAGRRRFWEKTLHGRFASLVAQRRLDQAETALKHALYTNQKDVGEVALVGAGPGDSGLLTLRGLQLMQQADVVLYDYLVSQEVLELVRRDADRICVGKRAGQQSMPQQEINRLLVRLAQQGKKVVRLKAGDPFIFGRGGEELQAIVAASIPFQVVPGITAAVGATAYAGIPLTHREHAQSITFITGHLRAGADSLDWQALARGRQTLAIYMGVVKAAEISNQLIRHGRSEKTPVAVISRGTRSDQYVQTGTLAALEELAQKAPLPTVLVIGEVVALHHEINWFGQQQLTAQKRAPVVNLA